jgi:hypothetical protein
MARKRGHNAVGRGKLRESVAPEIIFDCLVPWRAQFQIRIHSDCPRTKLHLEQSVTESYIRLGNPGDIQRATSKILPTIVMSEGRHIRET